MLALAFARIPPPFQQQVQALLLPTNDWRYVSESAMRLVLGWDDEEVSRQYSALWREASTFEVFRAFWRDVGEWDVREMLPNIMIPTLLVPATQSSLYGLEQSREIASLMPDARVAVIDGTTASARVAQAQIAIASVLFGGDAARPEPDAAAVRQGTAVIPVEPGVGYLRAGGAAPGPLVVRPALRAGGGGRGTAGAGAGAGRAGGGAGHRRRQARALALAAP